MNVEQIIGLRVVEKEHGSSVGTVKGLLIDADEKKVAALAVGGADRRRSRYLPFEDVVSIEHDAVMIESARAFIDRGRYRATGILDHLEGRIVLTEDGKELGKVQSYDIDPSDGRILLLRFGFDIPVFGGLWRKSGERYEIGSDLIRTIGEHILVDNSAPEAAGMRKAA